MSQSPKLHLCNHLHFQELLVERNQLAKEVGQLRRNIDAATIVLQVVEDQAALELAEVRGQLQLLQMATGLAPTPLRDPDTLPFPPGDTLQGIPLTSFD